MSIKVLLVEDHDIVRQGIRALLEGENDIEVCGEANNGEEALRLVKKTNPDLVLMDMNMPIMNGVEATKKIKAEFPRTKILILSMHDHENYLIEMLDAGADGYILKNSSRTELLFALWKIANDGKYMGAEFTFSMLEKFKASNMGIPSIKRADIKITDREMDVLLLVADGKTNQEIAQQLFTSVRTIETRRKNLLDKTGTTNTATLIKYAVQHGLVK